LPSDAPDLPWQAWVDVLRDGFGLFSQSLSEVQFLLPKLEPLVEHALFERGADGLRSLIPEIQQRLAEERQRLDEQYALDKLEADEGDALRVETLKAADEATDFATHMNRWWSAALQLERYADAARGGVFRLG